MPVREGNRVRINVFDNYPSVDVVKVVEVFPAGWKIVSVMS